MAKRRVQLTHNATARPTSPTYQRNPRKQPQSFDEALPEKGFPAAYG